jgi:hypothetical protein
MFDILMMLMMVFFMCQFLDLLIRMLSIGLL